MQLQPMLRLVLTGVGILSLGIAGCTSPQRDFQASTQVATNNTQTVTDVNQTQAQAQTPELDVPYVPTSTAVVNEMLKLAKVTKDDMLYDLGSGDGRIVITAAEKFGTRGVGVDIDPQRVKEARENAQKAGVSDRVEFRQQDLFQTDLKNASVVTLYLLPEINLKLRPKLFSELKPGTRIVSHQFTMGDWKPEKVVQVGDSTIYSWVVPETIPENLR